MEFQTCRLSGVCLYRALDFDEFLELSAFIQERKFTKKHLYVRENITQSFCFTKDVKCYLLRGRNVECQLFAVIGTIPLFPVSQATRSDCNIEELCFNKVKTAMRKALSEELWYLADELRLIRVVLDMKIATTTEAIATGLFDWLHQHGGHKNWRRQPHTPEEKKQLYHTKGKKYELVISADGEIEKTIHAQLCLNELGIQHQAEKVGADDPKHWKKQLRAVILRKDAIMRTVFSKVIPTDLMEGKMQELLVAGNIDSGESAAAPIQST